MSWLIEAYLEEESDSNNSDTSELNRKIQEYKQAIKNEQDLAKEQIEKCNSEYEENAKEHPENKTKYAAERNLKINSIKKGLQLAISKNEEYIRDLEAEIKSREPKHKVEK